MRGGGSADSKLAHLLAYTDEPHQFTPAETEQLITAIDSLNILDPACGSGAFPMGILQKLVFLLGKLDPGNAQWRQRQIDRVRSTIAAAEQIDDSTFRESTLQELEREIASINEAFERNELDYGRKLYLIENCIYGVDIQPIATQIAKLRVFISLIVAQRLDDTQPNRGVRPLPNLETKFVAANTLLGIEGQLSLRSPEISEKERQLEEVRRRHFTARTPRTKERYRQQDKHLRTEISALLAELGLPSGTAQELASWEPYNQNAVADFFDAEWMFGISEGFDIVIGNPPYIQLQKSGGALGRLYQNADFETFARTGDIYCLFYERGAHLLAANGHLCYITSNKFMRSSYGKNLRQFLTSQVSLQALLDFGSVSVFDAAVDTCIILLAKGSPAAEHRFQVAPLRQQAEDFNVREEFERQGFSMRMSQLVPEGWVLTSPDALALIEKLQNNGTPFSELIADKFHFGIKTGCNAAFIIDDSVRAQLIAGDANSSELIKPLLRGRNLRKWKAGLANEHLIMIASSANRKWPWSNAEDEASAERIFAEIYPAVHRHLSNYRDRLIARADKGTFYWELRSCDYYDALFSSKIVWRRIAKSLDAIYDTAGTCSLDTTLFIPTHDLSLLAILNSTIFDWSARYNFGGLGDAWAGGGLFFFAQHMKHVPIAARTAAQQAELSRLVAQILAAPDSDNVRALERQIDALVYRLYGLSSAEIALIEQTYRDAGMEV